MAVSAEVVDWLACCGRKQYAPKFINIGVDSINKLRNLPEDQIEEIGLDTWMYHEVTAQDQYCGGVVSGSISECKYNDNQYTVECVWMPELWLACHYLYYFV